MWIMTNFGILMPASIPADVKLTLRNDKWDLQVRSRDYATLQKCRRRYLAWTDTSQIVRTPHLDYDYRFYCDAADFGQAVSQMIIQIDYEKFKPTTDRKGAGGKKLHRLYNKIWGVVIDHYHPLPSSKFDA